MHESETSWKRQRNKLLCTQSIQYPPSGLQSITIRLTPSPGCLSTRYTSCLWVHLYASLFSRGDLPDFLATVCDTYT